MKKHKTKIIAAVVVLAVLAGSWILGAPPEIYVPQQPVVAEVNTPAELLDTAPAVAIDDERMDEEYNAPLPEITEEELAELEEEAQAEDQTEDQAEDQAEDIQIFGDEHPDEREPVEPEDVVIGDGYFFVTLSVRADMILNNKHLLHRDKHELVPADGIIFPVTEVIAYEGESVFNVLQREMRRNGIHMSSRFTPMFNSAYVEAINNLYEFDVGSLSGWMYSVNGWFPNFGASRYLLSPGDAIEWLYTVDLGRDLGVYWLNEDLYE